MTRGTGVVTDPLHMRFRVRAVRAGVWPSLFTCFYTIVFYLLTIERPNRSLLLALSAVAMVGSLLVSRLPVERIMRSRWREAFFLCWSASLVALVSVGAILDGGVRSPLAFALFLPLAFAALSYPVGPMLGVAAMTLTGFASVALLGHSADLAFLLAFACAIVSAGWICAWQAHNHELQRRELSRVSRVDPLTGCLNRRGFEERFAAELAVARREGVAPLTLLVLDLDDFKATNDARGHAAGDELLCWTVGTLTDVLRAGDSVGRLGGDEFAVLLRADAESAAAVTERALSALSERAPASAGCATFPLDGETADALHHHADEQLYANKGGRDRRPQDERREISWAAALASTVDARMAVTHEHGCAVAAHAETIARELGFEEAELSSLRLAAMLHDVGKVRVPEAILRKPGPLDDAERAAVREHAAAGAELVARVDGLAAIVPWIRHSHEHMDGSGYPDGLSGEAIPLASRVLLVADAFDAMTSDRPYRRAMSAERALDELRRCAGAQFDPDCVAALESRVGDERAAVGD